MEAIEPLDYKSLLQANALFSGLSENDLDLIASLVKERVFAAQEFIIHENEPGSDEFYLIKSGEVEILKGSADENNQNLYQITKLSVGETIGEIALLENVERTASARAITETCVLVVPINKIRELSGYQENYKKIFAELKFLQASLNEPPSYAKMALNLAKKLSSRLNNTNLVTADALRQELELSQIRVATGKFIILMVSTIVFYTYCLSAISSFKESLSSTTIIAIPMMFVFTAVIIAFMINSGYSARFFGLTLENWRKSAIEGIVWSIPVMALVVLIKWVVIHYLSYDLPLFEGLAGAFNENISTGMIIAFTAAYLIMTPLQELVVRGAIQGSLQHFFIGKHRILAAIIISNLLFGMTHLHLSLTIGLVVVVFGIFWGFMYARHRNLIGVSISHLLIGGWGFFIVGIQTVLVG